LNPYIEVVESNGNKNRQILSSTSVNKIDRRVLQFVMDTTLRY